MIVEVTPKWREELSQEFLGLSPKITNLPSNVRGFESQRYYLCGLNLVHTYEKIEGERKI
jgi:hypothetical protein